MICPKCGCEYAGGVCPYCQDPPSQGGVPFSNFSQQSQPLKEAPSNSPTHASSRPKWYKDAEVYGCILIALAWIFYLFGYEILCEVIGLGGFMIIVIYEIITRRRKKKLAELEDSQ